MDFVWFALRFLNVPDVRIEDPNYFRSAATVSSLVRETLNARTIERTRRKTLSGMTLANNKKNN